MDSDHLLLVQLDFVIPAVFALANNAAANPDGEALTVVLEAHGLGAVTSAAVDHFLLLRRLLILALKRKGVLSLSFLDDDHFQLMVLFVIVAGLAVAAGCAISLSVEARTIQF